MGRVSRRFAPARALRGGGSARPGALGAEVAQQPIFGLVAEPPWSRPGNHRGERLDQGRGALPPRQELAEADGLWAFVHVLNAYRRRETLALAEQQDLTRIQVVDGVVYVPIGRLSSRGDLPRADDQPRHCQC